MLEDIVYEDSLATLNNWFKNYKMYKNLNFKIKLFCGIQCQNYGLS